jgi:hypothetical protein
MEEYLDIKRKRNYLISLLDLPEFPNEEKPGIWKEIREYTQALKKLKYLDNLSKNQIYE